MNTPSEMLAETILQHLVGEKLVRPDSLKKLIPLLASGRMKAEDWRLEVELAAKQGSDT